MKEFDYVYLHHPTCSKAKKCLEFLNDKIPLQFQLIDYTLEPLTPEKLTELVDMMEQEDLDLLVREGNYKDKTDIVKVLSENPSLMQRPILINSKMKKAVVGRPLERIESIL